MAKNKEKDLPPAAMTDPELRKKFKTSLAMITKYMRRIDTYKEGMSDAVSDISIEYKVDKKLVRKLSNTMYKSNYRDLLEENRHFEQLYEQVIEGKLREPDDLSAGEPVDFSDDAFGDLAEDQDDDELLNRNK